MKVLVTGHDGYIGCTLVPLLQKAGHEVVGLDSYLYEGCVFGADNGDIHALRLDVREVEAEHLDGLDAVIHLAAISNDPVGDLNPQCTYDVNYHASVRVAAMAKRAGVPRFLFSSSCSLYGAAAGSEALDENADFNPVTPYGESKVLAEQAIGALADDSFSPTFLRNGTAYGVSTRLRGDLVLNNLVGYAFTTGEVRLMSDGTPWRPLVHIGDISGAMLAALEAPREAVHNEAFNVGRNDENYQIRDLAEIVGDVVAGSTVTLAGSAGPDKRSYRVNFDKIAERLPGFKPRWTARLGAEELLDAYRRNGLTLEDLTGSRYQRIGRIKELLAEGRIDDELRRQEDVPAIASA